MLRDSSKCVVCGVPIERRGARGPAPTYCSAKCRRATYEEQYNEKRRLEHAVALAERPVWRYLAMGGGVNSVALMLLLLDQGIEHEAVYADGGPDWPETVAYVHMLKERGYPVTVLDTRQEGKTLTEWCLHHAIMPCRVLRWCTNEWKIRPLSRYFHKPAVCYIGIDSGEVWRIRSEGIRDRKYEYPLVEAGIDRQGCEQIIRDHGLPVPEKSHCYICPFQPKRDFIRLREEHPDLFKVAKRVEDVTNARLHGLGREPMYLIGKPLDIATEAAQVDMLGEHYVQPCLCGI